MSRADQFVSTADLATRLAGKFFRSGDDDCWLWTAGRDGRGYGKIKIRGAHVSAHRVSWIVHVGQIPADIHVLHRCDVPSCINPKHLFLGSHADNMRDMRAKGRYRGGRRRLKPTNVAAAQVPGAEVRPNAGNQPCSFCRSTDDSLLTNHNGELLCSLCIEDFHTVKEG